MKKGNLFLVLALVLFCSTGHARISNSHFEQPNGGSSEDLLGTQSLTINATGTATTQAYPAYQGRIRSLWVKFTSATGTPDISKVELLVSRSENGTYIEADGTLDLFTSIADETEHVTDLTPMVCSWYKIKFTGGSSNPADTVVALIELMEASEF